MCSRRGRSGWRGCGGGELIPRLACVDPGPVLLEHEPEPESAVAMDHRGVEKRTRTREFILFKSFWPAGHPRAAASRIVRVGPPRTLGRS